MNIGDKLYQIRHELGLSQPQFAKKCGIPTQRYGRYERNETTPSLQMCEKFCRRLNVSLDYLISSKCNKQQDLINLVLLKASKHSDEEIKEITDYAISLMESK